MDTINTLQHEKETKLKKLRSRVYSLIGFYRSRGFLNRGQMYAYYPKSRIAPDWRLVGKM